MDLIKLNFIKNN